MSKSLGKHKVLVEIYIDDQLTKTRIENRVVYETKRGYEVNFLEGKRKIERLPNGDFVWKYRIFTVKPRTIGDILTKLGIDTSLL